MTKFYVASKSKHGPKFPLSVYFKADIKSDKIFVKKILGVQELSFSQ